MHSLFIELYGEEIPALLQSWAAKQLSESVVSAIKSLADEEGAGDLNYQYFSSPTRLVAFFQQVPSFFYKQSQKIKGPRVEASDAAIAGFIKKHKLIDQQSLIVKDRHYYCELPEQKVAAKMILKEIIEEVLQNFAWPKSMKWDSSGASWIRPLRSILCLFDDSVLEVKFGEISAGNATFGHKFLAPERFAINSFESYQKQLRERYVEFDHRARREKILALLCKVEEEHGISLIKDEDLLDEVTGLVEYPQVITGEIDVKFMSLPSEVLIATLKQNQKYFMFEREGKLSTIFAITTNTKANETILEGNLKVLQARLCDAEFFFNQDVQNPIESYLQHLDTLSFHEKIGNMREKSRKVQEMARKLVEQVDVDQDALLRAAMLAKADLLTEMVREFPELQGIMGYYYALKSCEKPEVALAIKEHYWPRGRSDGLPTTLLSATLALADKLDTLDQMFRHGIKPTGSKDPYALRRAAIGVVRIQNQFKINLDFRVLGLEKELQNFIEKRSINVDFNHNL